jgi:hypothetical protein
MDPLNQTTPTTTPAAAPPASTTVTSGTPAPSSQSSASGPGSSGTVPGSGTTNPTPAVPTAAPAQAPTGFGAGNSPATQGLNPAAPAAGQPAQQPAAPSFDEQFTQRYGMHPSQAQLLMQMGYRQYAGQQGNPAAQPQAGQPQPARPSNPWGVPEFDQRLLNFVSRDPATGQLTVLPGGPPDAALRVQQYQEAFREAHRKLIENPQEALGEIVEQRAQQLFDRMFQQRFGAQQQQQAAQQLLQENSDWLYERGQDGNVQQRFDPASGQMRPVLSQWGQFYARQVQQLQQAGVTDSRMQHQLAVQAIQTHLYQAQLRQFQAQQAGQTQQQQFVQQAAAAQPGGAQPTPSHLTPPAPAQGMTLRDRMMASMNQNGLTDEMLAQQLRSPMGSAA